MAASLGYAVRLARHALVDALVAPLSEALKRRDFAGVVRAAIMEPFIRSGSLIRYRLVRSRRAIGRPIPKRTWDFEYRGATWAGLDSMEAIPGNMAIVGLVHRLCAAPRILDVGCGTGALAELLQLVPNLSYTGIDLSDVAVSRARARNLVHATFEQAAMEDWLPLERYDAVIFNEVIYYTPHPMEVLARYADALTTCGGLVVSIWRSGNYRLLWSDLEREYALAASAVVESGGVTRDIKLLRKRIDSGERPEC